MGGTRRAMESNLRTNHIRIAGGSDRARPPGAKSVPYCDPGAREHVEERIKTPHEPGPPHFRGVAAGNPAGPVQRDLHRDEIERRLVRAHHRSDKDSEPRLSSIRRGSGPELS